jgi:hypothetical protein
MELYLGGPYQSFCDPCGKAYKSGTLKYSAKDKRYIDISTKKTCDFCEELSIGVLHGKSVCDEHIGSVMNDQI